MQAPEGTERNVLEITLATLQGVSAFHMFGVGSEAKSVFERAYRLLADVPEHPMRGRLLHGFGYLLGLRGDYALALEVAERAETLSCDANDQELLLAACIVRGEVHHLQGRTKTTRRWLERALAIAEPLDIGTNEIFAADPQVMLHGMLAIELVRSGLIEQARIHMQQARARAQALRQPMTWLVAAWQEVLIEVRMGNHVRVAALADDMQALVDEYSLALGRTACRWWRGWADARNGAPRDGYRRIREAYEEHTGLGMRSGASEVLGYATEALLLAGDCNAAQVELQEAFRWAKNWASASTCRNYCCWRQRSRERRVSPTPASLRCGAQLKRLAPRKHRGWSCKRWSNCASTLTLRPRTNRYWPRWLTSRRKLTEPSWRNVRAR